MIQDQEVDFDIDDDEEDGIAALAARNLSPLRHLHDTQQSVEKLRIGVGNRVAAIAAGRDENSLPVPEIYQKLIDAMNDLEGTCDAAIAKEVKSWPVYDEWLRHVKGIGPGLAGQMLALLLPPIPEKGPSSWYKAAGLSPERRCDTCNKPIENDLDAERNHAGHTFVFRLPRARKGEGKTTHHRWLRRCLHNVATSFVRNGGYYRTVYEQRKARLVQVHAGDPAWPPHRLDAVARWATIKLFLAHLWERWCEIEGIPNRQAYAVAQIGHQYIPAPMPREDGKKI